MSLMNKMQSITIYVKLYPKVETCSFQVERLQTIKDVKTKIRELYSGLTDQDSLRFVWNNKPLNSEDLSMWDIGVEEMDTFHVVVRGPNETNYEPKEKKPKSLVEFVIFLKFQLFSFVTFFKTTKQQLF